MLKVNNVTGLFKKIFKIKVKLSVFFHFFIYFLQGRLSLRQFSQLIRRLQFFLFKLEPNKFVQIGENTKLDLYVPGFPSKAFYTAAHKFTFFKRQMPCTTVLLSVTSACPNNCPHCYQKLDGGQDVDIDILIDAAIKMQNLGVAFFNIEGGEPFLVFDRLIKLCSAIDHRSEIWINSTGVGIRTEKLLELKKLNNVTGIIFSLHSPYPAEFNKFLGREQAWQTMVAGVKKCHQVGLVAAFNSCLSKEDYYNGNFEQIMDKALSFQGSLVQLIKPKSSGAWLGNEELNFSKEDIEHVKKLVHKYNQNKEYVQYPAIFAQIIEEDKELFGCTAGGIDRFYINAKGDLQPCEFLNISFGNIAADNFASIYNRMRNTFNWAGDCHLCEKYSQQIGELFQENNLQFLPLPQDLSEKVYQTWDRGNPTDLYQRIEKLK